MAAGGRGAVAEKVARFDLFQVSDGFAQSVGNDTALLGVALSFDIPQLQHVEEVVEGHAVEIVGVESFLNVPKLHGPQKHFEGVAAAITAARTVGISLRSEEHTSELQS